MAKIISRALTDTDGNIAPYDGAAEGEFLQISGGKIVGATPAPAGNTGEVQFNNAGAFAGSTNLRIVGADITSHARENEHTVIPEPSVASSGYGYTYVSETANRALVGVRGSEGPGSLLQPSIFGRRISQFYTGSSAVPQAIGHWSFTTNGTASRQSFNAANTNRLQNSVRIRYTSTAATNVAAGLISSQAVAWRGNATGLGGFFAWFRFGWDLAPASDCRVFVGLSASTTTATVTGNISAVGLVNAIGVGKNSGDTNYQLVLKDNAGAYSNTDLGVAPSLNDLIDVYLWAPPNSAYINARVFDVNAGSDLYASAAIGSGLPANNALLYAHVLASTGPTSVTAIQWCTVYGYLEQNL